MENSVIIPSSVPGFLIIAWEMEKVTSPCLSNSGLTAVFNPLGTRGECKYAREAVTWLHQRPPQHETGKPHGWCLVPTTEAHPAYGRPPE